jgi:hypothetical protein
LSERVCPPGPGSACRSCAAIEQMTDLLFQSSSRTAIEARRVVANRHASARQAAQIKSLQICLNVRADAASRRGDSNPGPRHYEFRCDHRPRACVSRQTHRVSALPPIVLASSRRPMRSKETSAVRGRSRHNHGTNAAEDGHGAMPIGRRSRLKNAVVCRDYRGVVALRRRDRTSSTSWGSQVRALHRPSRSHRAVLTDYWKCGMIRSWISFSWSFMCGTSP